MDGTKFLLCFVFLEGTCELSLNQFHVSRWMLQTCLPFMLCIRATLSADEPKLRAALVCTFSKHTQVSTYMDLIGTSCVESAESEADKHTPPGKNT